MTVDIRTVLAVIVLAVVGLYAFCFLVMWGFASETGEKALEVLFVLSVLTAIGLSVWWLL